ncbi:MAG: DUF5665 domain-containing protein [Thermovirgaceae bacterium]|nr:DUF5665 domain-containing protein [Thermovirgaceae bacterium]
MANRKNPAEAVEKVKKDTLTRLAEVMEKSRVLENLEMILDRRKLLWNNFLAGLARGLGFGVGLTVLAAIVIYFLVVLLKSIVALNIPLIGTYIAELVEIVQEQIKIHR